jgi:hypothetical protein
LSTEPFSNIEISNNCDNSLINAAVINPGEKILLMDVRKIIGAEEIAAGYAEVSFGWQGFKKDSSKTSGEVVQRISTTSGLLVN